MLEIEFPGALAAIPVLWILITLIALRSRSESHRLRKVVSLWLRLLTVAALAFAMSSPSLRTSRALPPAFVYLLDVSESMDDRSLEVAMADIERHSSISAGPHALVLFAGRTHVAVESTTGPIRFDGSLRQRILHRRTAAELSRALEQNPQLREQLDALTAYREAIDPYRTRLDEGLLAAQLQFHADRTNLVVAFTDGHELQPPPSGTPITFVKTPGPLEEALVQSVQAPATVRIGEPFDLKVTIRSVRSGKGKLSILVDNRTELSQDVAYGAGETVVRIRNVQQKAPLEPKLHTITACLEPERDTERRNNRASALTLVVGKPRVLILKGPGLNEKPIRDALDRQDFQVTERPHSALRDLKSDLGDYDAVIFLGMPEAAAVADSEAELEAFVADRGGGLFLLCDPSMVTRTEAPLAKFLPVKFSGAGPSQPSRQPGPRPSSGSKTQLVKAAQVTLLLLIDKSGSMAGKNLELAKAACLAAARTLSDKDYVGVIGFDARPHWVVDITPANDMATIEDRVLRLRADGGTDIAAALVEAHRALSRVKTAVKHVVVLSDGETQPYDFDALVGRMRQDGITVSTVTLYELNSKPEIMRTIAEAGGGRSFTSNADRLPRIFTNEVKHVLKELKRDDADLPVEPESNPPPAHDPGPGAEAATFDFSPVKKLEHEALQGIDFERSPRLHGLVPSEPRPTAQVPLVSSERSRPLLALWRYGLGKTAVWTSDFGGRWSAEFAAWDRSVQMMAQVLRFLAGARSDSMLANRVSLSVEGHRARLVVERAENESIEANLIGQGRLPLRVADDRRYEAFFTMEKVATDYVVALRSSEHLAHIGARLEYEPEIASTGPSEDFFRASRQAGYGVYPAGSSDALDLPARIASNIRVDLTPWLLVGSLLLLTLDVLVRRLRP